MARAFWMCVGGLVIGTSACGPVMPQVRERCDADARRIGAPVDDAEILLVQNLLRMLSTDDFRAFQALQPTQSQYLAYAWLHGAKQADELVGIIQHPDSARNEFGELVKRLRAAGIEARSADRCTRRLAWDPKATDRYDLVVAVGKERLTVPIYATSERLSVAGALDLELSGARIFLFQALALAADYTERLERAATKEAALASIEAFSRDHAADIAQLDAMRVSLSGLAGLNAAVGTTEVAQRVTNELTHRADEALARFPGLRDDPRFQAALRPFEVLSNKVIGDPSTGPTYDAPKGDDERHPGGQLPPTCVKFLAGYEACAKFMPEAAQGPLRDGIAQMRDAWSGLPAESLEPACRSAMDAAKTSLSSLCPSVKWE